MPFEQDQAVIVSTLTQLLHNTTSSTRLFQISDSINEHRRWYLELLQLQHNVLYNFYCVEHSLLNQLRSISRTLACLANPDSKLIFIDINDSKSIAEKERSGYRIVLLSNATPLSDKKPETIHGHPLICTGGMIPFSDSIDFILEQMKQHSEGEIPYYNAELLPPDQQERALATLLSKPHQEGILDELLGTPDKEQIKQILWQFLPVYLDALPRHKRMPAFKEYVKTALKLSFPERTLERYRGMEVTRLKDELITELADKAKHQLLEATRSIGLTCRLNRNTVIVRVNTEAKLIQEITGTLTNSLNEYKKFLSHHSRLTKQQVAELLIKGVQTLLDERPALEARLTQKVHAALYQAFSLSAEQHGRDLSLEEYAEQIQFSHSYETTRQERANTDSTLINPSPRRVATTPTNEELPTEVELPAAAGAEDRSRKLRSIREEQKPNIVTFYKAPPPKAETLPCTHSAFRRAQPATRAPASQHFRPARTRPDVWCFTGRNLVARVTYYDEEATPRSLEAIMVDMEKAGKAEIRKEAYDTRSDTPEFINGDDADDEEIQLPFATP